MDIAALGYEINSSQARTAAKDLDRMNAAAQKVERSAKSLKSTSRDLLRDEKGRFLSAAQSVEKYGDEIDALRMKYNPLYAASKQFEAQQSELRRALELGAISVAQYENQLQLLQSGMIRSGNAAVTYGRGMSNAGRHTANVFAQLNDIGVMMASGQNPLILAMQQGTQLNQVWGQMGGRIGGVAATLRGAFMSMISPINLLTIGVIAGGAALVQWGISALGAKEDTKSFTEQLDETKSVMSELSGSVELINTPMYELLEQFGIGAFRVREMNTALAELMQLRAIDSMATSLVALTGNLEGVIDRLEIINSPSVQGVGGEMVLARQVRLLKEEFGLTVDEANNVKAALDNLKTAQGPMQQSVAARELAKALMSVRDESGQIPPALRAAAENTLRFALEADKLAGIIQDAKTAMDSLREAAPGGEWLSGAIERAGTLASKLWDAAAATAASGGGATRDQKLKNAYGLYAFTRGQAPTSPVSDGGGVGGGAGGGADPYEENLNRLIESLRTERETVDAWYQENLTILEDRRAQEILGEQAHKEALLALEMEYQEKLRSLQEQQAQFVVNARGRAISAAQSFMQTLAGQSEGAAKALLAVNTALSIAQAIQNTSVAATRALAELGPIAGPPAAAAIKSFGAAEVALIAANGVLQMGSRGGGGGRRGASATTSATSTPAEPERVTRIELMGEDWLVSLAETMMDQIYTATGNGKVVIARG